ncbi:FAD-dependent oxidoreductase [Catellatospora sichuanensis]|uniref:FAD-dependent oxidoreductase n=1 Tax=Catellatospora sichuanensis TaxID=1969805 RepID=UPI0011821FAE|nr:FAD-dependent monooxygenase [Catellatospora sichuanensis]
MTSPRQLSVMIIGGGIGGLCLAHGLRRAGVDVTVHERTTARTDWLQGYRIHINPHGSRALHDCLDPAAWQAFLGTVSDAGGGLGFATEQLADLLRLRGEEIADSAEPAARHYGVSRLSLREVLLSGMDDVVRLGQDFERYELLPDGRVMACFADGTTAAADVLIGADGANSRVRAQLLPHAAGRVDTGVTGIAGKHRLDGPLAASLPAALTDDTNIVIPAGEGFLFTAVWKHDRRAVAADPAMPAGFLLDNTADYTFWAYADATARFPADVDALAGQQLTALVLERTRGWSPALRQLIEGSDPSTVNVVRMRSAVPVGPWPTGVVTLLGDAIHSMTPMAGVGANTALRDADLLRRQLTAVSRGEQQLVPALADYERQMLDYGFAAVRESARNTRQAGSASRMGRAAFRGVLRAVAAVPALRRRMAASIGG